MSWIGVESFQDKAHKLSVHNSIKRKTNNTMHLPVEIENLSSPGGTLKRYMIKLSPGQKGFYCRSVSQLKGHKFGCAGFPNAEMSPKDVIGVHKIRVMTKEALKRLGISTTGHGARRLAITIVVNDATVNMSESLAFVRHNFLGAQRSYITHDNNSGYARFLALRSFKPKEDDDE